MTCVTISHISSRWGLISVLDSVDIICCTCGHWSDEHRRSGGSCQGLCSYGLRCGCPSLEPDPNAVDATDDDVDRYREEELAAGRDL